MHTHKQDTTNKTKSSMKQASKFHLTVSPPHQPGWMSRSPSDRARIAWPPRGLLHHHKPVDHSLHFLYLCKAKDRRQRAWQRIDRHTHSLSSMRHRNMMLQSLKYRKNLTASPHPRQPRKTLANTSKRRRAQRQSSLCCTRTTMNLLRLYVLRAASKM